MTIQPFGFYVLRKPLLSVDELFLLNKTSLDLQHTEDFLRQLFSETMPQEALYIASPNLYERFQAWLNGESISEKGKLIQTLFKYYLRMCSRCTPYGMFAGCSVGEFSDETKIIIQDENPFYKHIRLDTNYLSEIVNYLLKDDSILKQLKFYPNNTIYRVGNNLHYLFYTYQNNKREYSICAVEDSEILETFLKEAQNGIYLNELTEMLVSDEISIEEAKDFVRQLIQEQILFSEIEPTISGENFFDTLIATLKQLSIDKALLNNLTLINNLLKSESLKIEDYQKIQEALNSFVGKKHQDFIQTDLFFNFQQNTIHQSVADSVTKNLQKLLVLNQASANTAMQDFKQKFYARYEEKEISLAHALDNETGIGYGNFISSKAGILPIIEDISHKTTSEKNIKWAFWEKFTLEKYTDAIQNKSLEIRLTDKDLNEIKEQNSSNQHLPPTFYAFGSIYKDTTQQPYFHLKNVTGASALPMLGRFASGNKKLKEKLIECAEYEQDINEDVIFAEIIHIPEARIGNISARPQLRSYEIPYHTPSALPTENQILIEDLMISVRRGIEVVLRSKKLNKRIIPRLSSAHNYENGLNVYRFLCDLQNAYEGINISWHWHILKDETFLPRVSYQNIILSPATWNLSLTKLKIHKNDISIPKLKEIRNHLSIPRYVKLSEFDNELWLDFENEICLNLLKEHLSKNENAVLKEVLFSADECFIKTPAGSFTNEIIIPYKNLSYKPHYQPINKRENTLQRSFSVGSEWLYFKIYCGEKTADDLLANEIKTFVDELLETQTIEQFFFIRYQDPEPHIRLRFMGNPTTFFYAKVIEKLNLLLQPFQENGLVHKIQIDTYNREIERYGETTMLPSEELFFADSMAVLNFLQNATEDYERLWFGLRRINTYLNIFGLNIEQKKDFAEKMQKSFLQEFGGESELRKKLNDKFREVSIDLQTIFEETESFKIYHLTTQINTLITDNQQFYDLLSSYIHMFINRLFISNNRTYELLLYHFLTKLYIRELNFQTADKY